MISVFRVRVLVLSTIGVAMATFGIINEAAGPKTFWKWRPSTGNPNGDPKAYELAQDRMNDLMGTTPEAPARADQPSPTGNDADLAMSPVAKPRMIAGSAQAGYGDKVNVPDPREERE